MTIVIMSVFKHAQPALLYLVPFCIGLPLFLALVKGDLSAMFSYKDHPEEEEAAEGADEKANGETSTKNKKEAKKVK